jgi:hypothetical protein
MQDGANKYGRMNWRTTEVTPSIFYDAIQRHLEKWYHEGEQRATDSGVHHLGHAMAGCAILLDAELVVPEVFRDDRPTAAVDIFRLLINK